VRIEHGSRSCGRQRTFQCGFLHPDHRDNISRNLNYRYQVATSIPQDLLHPVARCSRRANAYQRTFWRRRALRRTVTGLAPEALEPVARENSPCECTLGVPSLFLVLPASRNVGSPFKCYVSVKASSQNTIEGEGFETVIARVLEFDHYRHILIIMSARSVPRATPRRLSLKWCRRDQVRLGRADHGEDVRLADNQLDLL
jgi:hypothetical protein